MGFSKAFRMCFRGAFYRAVSNAPGRMSLGIGRCWPLLAWDENVKTVAPCAEGFQDLERGCGQNVHGANGAPKRGTLKRRKDRLQADVVAQLWNEHLQHMQCHEQPVAAPEEGLQN